MQISDSWRDSHLDVSFGFGCNTDLVVESIVPNMIDCGLSETRGPDQLRRNDGVRENEYRSFATRIGWMREPCLHLAHDPRWQCSRSSFLLRCCLEVLNLEELAIVPHDLEHGQALNLELAGGLADPIQFSLQMVALGICRQIADAKERHHRDGREPVPIAVVAFGVLQLLERRHRCCGFLGLGFDGVGGCK